MSRLGWNGTGAVLLGGVLLLTGGAKYIAPDLLQGAILGQAPVGLVAAGLLSIFVPSLELAVGVGVLLPSWRRASLALAVALLAAMLAWKILLLVRGFSGDCGCFGLLGAWPAGITVWFDAGLLALAIALHRMACRPTG